MTMFRWDPTKDMISLRQAMQKLVEQSVIRSSGFTLEVGTGGNIPVDMYQTDSDIIVKATLPGVKPEEVDVMVTGDVLTIKTERKDDSDIREQDFVRKENRYGPFSRALALPVAVQPDKAEAVFENGILRLKLPKAEQAKPKQIKVQAKKAQPATEPMNVQVDEGP